MRHLSPDQVTELRAELDRQLRRLERSMEVTAEALRPVELDQTAVGRLSRMDSIQNHSVSRNLREREKARLAQLVEAVSRLERGTYGICTRCEAPIPFERLFVFPEAPSCSACADAA